MVYVYETGDRATAENFFEESGQLVSGCDDSILIEVGKTVNREKYMRGFSCDLSVLALAPGPASGPYLISGGIYGFTWLDGFFAVTAKRQECVT